MLPTENITPQTNPRAEEATVRCTSLLPGQEFSPYRKFKCVQIPVPIVGWRALPALARVLYGFLPSRHSRTRDFAERVGTMLGRSVSTIKRGLATLQQHGFAGRGGRTLLWHDRLKPSWLSRSPIPAAGDVFDPFRKLKGIRIPESLVSMPDLSWSAKLIYGCLMVHAREKTYCFPYVNTLARELACSQDTVTKSLNQLVQAALLRWEHSRAHPPRFIFIWHPALETSLLPPVEKKRRADDQPAQSGAVASPDCAPDVLPIFLALREHADAIGAPISEELCRQLKQIGAGNTYAVASFIAKKSLREFSNNAPPSRRRRWPVYLSWWKRVVHEEMWPSIANNILGEPSNDAPRDRRRPSLASLSWGKTVRREQMQANYVEALNLEKRRVIQGLLQQWGIDPEEYGANL